MALTVGDRFGVYQIVTEISAGGMGVVYRARDTRLDRDVAASFTATSSSPMSCSTPTATPR